MIEPLLVVLKASRLALELFCREWEKSHRPMPVDPFAVIEQIGMHIKRLESVPQRSREEAIKSLTECMEQYMAELS